MMRQIRILAKTELCNLYNFNVFRHTRDRKEKLKSGIIALALVMVLGMLEYYVVLMCNGLIQVGIGDIIPAYLMVIASALILMFGIFKTGGTIFRKNGYDIISSLPLKKGAIVASRFLRVYVEELAVTLLVLVPGYAVYGWMLRPSAGFYLMGVLSILVTPLIPVALACAVGAVITGIASRMKHKALAETIVMILFLGGLIAVTSLMPQDMEEMTPAMMLNLTGMLNSMISRIYPPAVWIGTAVIEGSILKFLPGAILSAMIFGGIAALVTVKFHAICSRLYSTTAKHNYQMQKLQTSSVRKALVKREMKRYLSSSVYVTNTIIGPIMGMAFCIALLFFDADEIAAMMMLPMDVTVLIPFLIAGIYTMMNTTGVSVSMEGKEWWIVKTLPLKTKTILDAKLLFGLGLVAPFFVIGEAAALIALRPSGPKMVWMVLIPFSVLLFSNVCGITANLLLPKMNWENEVTVVKQSASAMVGGMSGFLAAIVTALPVVFLPEKYTDLICLADCVVLLILTAVLYCRNNRTDLRRII